jgi:hypothetical protein
VKINVIFKNIVRHLSLAGSADQIDINCHVVLIDRHDKEASIRYKTTIRVNVTDQEFLVSILGGDLVLLPYSTEFISRVAFKDEFEAEIVYLEAGFVMHTGDTVNINGAPTAKLEEETKSDETLTESTIKDIDDLPDIEDWPSIIK